MSQNEFFISHSSDDSELVGQFVDFLQIALNVNRSSIYCTSGTGTKQIGTGVNFIEDIKQNVAGTKMVIFILTPNYFESNFCLAELGAAWALSSRIYPIIIPPTPRSLLKSTPLSESTQALTLNTAKDLVKLADEFVGIGAITGYNGTLVNARSEVLIQWMQNNCSFEQEDVISKEEYETLQKEIKEIAELNITQAKEIEQLRADNKRILALKDPEDAKEYIKQTSDQWERFEKYVNEVRGALSALDILVISAIYHDSYFRKRQGFTPVNFDRLDWEQTVSLEADQSIIRDENTFYPNYNEHNTKPAVAKLKELEAFISNEVDEQFYNTFEEEYKFNLDMTSKKLWEKLFGVTIFM